MQRLLRNTGRSRTDDRAATIAQFIRDTVRASVAPISLERYQVGRADLIRDLGRPIQHRADALALRRR